VKLALVTSAPSTASPVAASAFAIVASLAERVDLALFVEPGSDTGAVAGLPLRSAVDLDPRAFDHIVYVLGNERAHGFMVRLVRALGGTVAIDCWNLPELALGAHPELSRRTLRGAWAAWLECGLLGARRHVASIGVAGAPASGLVYNRTVVRHADAFLVADAELAPRIRAERNAPTAIAVVPWNAERPDLVADRWVEHLAAFPAPRTRRKSLIRTMIEASDRVRAERGTA
jgi:hypothetical protein